MNIFLDDIRFPNEVAVYTKNSVYSYNWVIVRNYEQFVKACIAAYQYVEWDDSMLNITYEIY